MPLEDWLDLKKRAEGRITILQTEAGGIFRDLYQQLDNELARIERGTAETQLIINGALNEARARIENRKRLLNDLWPGLLK